jgi:serine/threonine protein kinase
VILTNKAPLSPSASGSPIKQAVIQKKTATFEDFLPLRKLGRGSFGDVYLVKHLPSGSLYAMKTLSKRST